MPKKAFGEILKAARNSKKLTQEKLALNSGISRNTIVSLEKGEFVPTLETIFKVAQGLDMLPEELVVQTRVKMSETPNLD